MKKTDLAYIAGIVDGEGCIDITRSRNKNTTDSLGSRIQVVMTEEYIPKWLQLSFGGSVNKYKPRTPNRQPSYAWQANGRTAITFLNAILPYLIIKRPQAEIVIRLEALKPRYGFRSSPMEKFLQEIEARKLKNTRGRDLIAPKIESLTSPKSEEPEKPVEPV